MGKDKVLSIIRY